MNFIETFEEFGYKFNEDGQLRNKENGKSFEFCVKENDHNYNQKHYETLGELITPYIYNLLETKCELEKHPVPINAKEDELQTFIFASRNFDNYDKLLILLHGNGVVRAGQWSRRLIINDSMNSGTQIPFIKRAQKEGYAVIIANTNDNVQTDSSGNEVFIEGSCNPREHGNYVWKHYVRKCNASKIAIVAHSFGGVVAVNMYKEFTQEFEERVFAIAMTDSVHCGIPSKTKIMKISRNWVASSLPVNAQIKRKHGQDIPCFSAGCTKHEMTSWSSYESIFDFFAEKLLELNMENEHDISSSDDDKKKMPEKKQKIDNDESITV